MRHARPSELAEKHRGEAACWAVSYGAVIVERGAVVRTRPRAVAVRERSAVARQRSVALPRRNRREAGLSCRPRARNLARSINVLARHDQCLTARGMDVADCIGEAVTQSKAKEP